MKTLIRPMSAAELSFGARSNKTIKDFHMNPKVSIYKSDGTGRDEYINYNSGGYNTLTDTKYKQFHFALPGNPNKSSSISPKFAVYRSDGYGRDSYIYSNSGGFYKVPPFQKFINTLRNYDCFKSRKKYDYCYYANTFISPKEKNIMNRMSRLQRSSSQRLAIPKYYLGQRVMSPKINIDKEQIAQLLKGKNNNEEENLYKTFSPKCRSNEYGIIQPNNTNYSLKSRVYDQYNLYTPPNNLSPNNSREEFMVDNKFYIPENRLLRKNNSQKEFYSEAKIYNKDEYK